VPFIAFYGIYHFIIFVVGRGGGGDGSIDSLRTTTDNAMADPPFGHSHRPLVAAVTYTAVRAAPLAMAMSLN